MLHFHLKNLIKTVWPIPIYIEICRRRVGTRSFLSILQWKKVFPMGLWLLSSGIVGSPVFWHGKVTLLFNKFSRLVFFQLKSITINRVLIHGSSLVRSCYRFAYFQIKLWSIVILLYHVCIFLQRMLFESLKRWRGHSKSFA